MQKTAIIDFLKKCKVVKRISKDHTICVALSQGFDLELDKAVWKLEGNRSEVRDVFCSGCSRQVVMSNNAYRDYLENERANEVLCMECVLKIQQKHGK